MVSRVVVIGDVGVDVVVRPSAALRPGQDTPAETVLTPGGAGANLAARLARPGLQVTLVARVGNDEPAATARAELSAVGIDCRFAVDPDRPTCTVVVLVGPDGERTMLSDRGAAAGLVPGDLDLAEGPADRGRTHLHLSGYVLLDPRTRPAGLAALAAARSRGWTTSLDPQSSAVPETGPDPGLILSWCAGVDLLLPNEFELAALGGPAAVSPVFGAVAMTRGPAGATFLSGSQRLDLARPSEAGPTGATGVDLPGPPGAGPAGVSGSRSPGAITTGGSVAIDTTGAGDAFNAGFLAAWLAAATPADALRTGMSAGTAATRHPGGRPR